MEVNSYAVLFCWMALMFLQGVQAYEFKRYEMLTSDENIDNSSQPLLRETAASAIACIVKCEAVPLCRYIFYNPKTSECINHSNRKAVVPAFQHWRESCPKSDYDYEDYTGKCYKVPNDPLKWEDARDACAADGGHLLTLNEPNDYNSTIFQGSSNYMWVGATDIAVEGEFRWLITDDVLSSSLPWGSLQPNGGVKEQCVMVKAETSTKAMIKQTNPVEGTSKAIRSLLSVDASGLTAKLYDEACGKQLLYICEL